MNKTLGETIKELRQNAGLTLRGFAEKVGISPAHQSDIEHNRRLPSDEKLGIMAEILSHVGATYEKFKKLDARIDPDLGKWISNNPEASAMLREVRDSRKDPEAILRKLKEFLTSEDDEDGTDS